jgi:hypothetical protein
MANWNVLTQVPIAASVQQVVDAIDAILSALDTVFQLIVAALEVVRTLALTSLNFLKTIVAAVLTLIQELIQDLLENNVAMTLHVNMNWNPYWLYNKERERDPRTGRIDSRLVDYAHDGQLPWAGTGLTGWLLDLLASSKDPTDPFRPVTDLNTKVYGAIIIKGIENPAELENSLALEDWISLFVNWRLWKFDPSQVVDSPHAESINKLLSSAIVDSYLPLFALGPKEAQFLSLKQAIVGNPLANYTSAFLPTIGNYPKWVSVPMAAVVPPLQNMFSNLQRLLGLLTPADDAYDALTKLIRTIQDMLNVLREAIQEVQDVLDLLLALAAFLTDSYILVLDTDSGGMDSFITAAIAAGDAPDFGTAGIVVGVSFLATQPDSQATLDKFLGILGIQTSAYLSTTTAQAEALSDTFSELYP